jgi:hypothetical protein
MMIRRDDQADHDPHNAGQRSDHEEPLDTHVVTAKFYPVWPPLEP